MYFCPRFSFLNLLYMKWRLFLVGITALSFSSSFAQNRSYSDMADSVYAALGKHDPSYLLPLLHDSCAISNLPRGINYRVIPLLLDKYPQVLEYKIVAIDKEPAGTRVKLEVMYEVGKAAYPDFLVGRSGTITELNVVKSAALNEQRMGGRVLSAPDTLSVPLWEAEGHLYVKAEADGRKGIFLLDSGIPDMILNRSYFGDSLKQVSTGTVEAGSTRGEGVLVRKVGAFNLGRMKLSNFPAMVMTEKVAGGNEGLPFLGAIGFSTLRDFEIRLDIAGGKMMLVKTDREGNYISQQYRPAQVTFMAPVEMRRQLPVILVTIGDRAYRMGIDCGVAGTIFFAHTKNAILPYITGVDAAVATQEGVPLRGIHGKLTKAVIGSLDFTDMAASIEGNNLAYAGAGDATPLDGILGTSFLQVYKIAINYKKKLIYFR